MSKAVLMVHWPGKSTPCCAKHARALEELGRAMGFLVTATPINPAEHTCKNCENEAEEVKG